MRQLARALKAEASAGRTLAVYAALQDKDAAGVVQALQGVVVQDQHFVVGKLFHVMSFATPRRV